jgi:hypothetical protein
MSDDPEPRPLPPGECTSGLTMAIALGLVLADRAGNSANLHTCALGDAMAAAEAQHGHAAAMAAFDAFDPSSAIPGCSISPRRCVTRLHQLRGLGDAKILKSLGHTPKGRHYRG